MDKASFAALANNLIEGSPFALKVENDMERLFKALATAMKAEGKKSRMELLADSMREIEPEMFAVVAVIETAINDIPQAAQEVALMFSGAILKLRDEKMFDRMYTFAKTSEGAN